MGVAALLLLAIGGLVALAFVSTKASLSNDDTALARINMPLAGGSVQSVTVVTGPHSRQVPVERRGDQIWPTHTVPAHQLLRVDVVVKRPGWIGWLTGQTQKLRLNVMTPSTSLVEHNLTLGPTKTILLRFKEPVRAFAYGPDPTHLTRQVLAKPLDHIRLPRPAEAGTIAVAAAPRAWETSPAAIVSWFPAGSSAGAVANPAPGTQLGPHTPITLTFSQPIDKALGNSRPPVSPNTPGTWQVLNSQVMVFKPQGYGYGLGSTVQVALPNGVKLAGGQQGASSSTGTWKVPGGSTLRLQQLLAQLGYLPVSWSGHHTSATMQAQEDAAIKPPSGSFDWRYSNVPGALRGAWTPGASGTITRGAVMAFQNDHNFTPDGVAGAALWRSLINAAIAGKRSHFGYSYVTVSLSGQNLNLWHNGRTMVTTPVNTGIPSRPTDPGTFPVYEHLSVTTMSGTNPDGSTYNDPGIQWVSYFNGGDALHAFTRAQYGFPQSLGCVEMQLDPAGKVWPYTPIGTLVHVA
ncbi:MAG: L,D-transpeptidase family protein [Solirubrobacterales bacterium]|nr:L,D-transpeptidase family protein [Solirubrobacterales bacterium]MBV9917785.1 L,D-transpeptidase family protein [Solirubrobacterales bacterium]